MVRTRKQIASDESEVRAASEGLDIQPSTSAGGASGASVSYVPVRPAAIGLSSLNSEPCLDTVESPARGRGIIGQIGRQRRMKWDRNMNIAAIRAYLLATNLEKEKQDIAKESIVTGMKNIRI
ncbi:unnamed protein product [Nezara viridula]|uniref:Uncharacterized protein n=1 Tax=Nezara viridula TaxID=85310 RepID=A0A9P0MN20_NEZVI|nr:unnamed protein product [Nezara viridula]